jgi:beta-glucanase (GH16 family)
MKKMFIYSLLMVCSGLMASCGDDTYNMPGEPAPNATITSSKESFSAAYEGESFTLEATTTAAEWNAYSNEEWISVSTENTASKSGTVVVTVSENPDPYARQGSVIIMSGTARKYIPVAQEAAPKSAYNAPEGYSLVWHDEFDEGSELNANDWTHEVWGKGTVNDEKQYYVNHVTPAGAKVTEIKDGKLRINCLLEDGKVYSGRVYAKVKEGWTYGYIEASIKLPKGKGTWPAFWMMPVNFKSWPADGEIDIMEEVGGHPNYVSSSLHANAHVHSNNTQVTHEMYLEGAEDDFHTYAIQWTHENITTYVDGQVQLSYDNRGLGRDDWPYDDPFYVILNLAWGGTWGGTYGIDESALPCTMEIDYVRVFQK